MAVKHLQKQRGRGQGRPFARGVSGNPAGRPPGVRNRATEAFETWFGRGAVTLQRQLDTFARQRLGLAVEQHLGDFARVVTKTTTSCRPLHRRAGTC
jgi:hypothetical protein